MAQNKPEVHTTIYIYIYIYMHTHAYVHMIILERCRLAGLRLGEAPRRRQLAQRVDSVLARRPSWPAPLSLLVLLLLLLSLLLLSLLLFLLLVVVVVVVVVVVLLLLLLLSLLLLSLLSLLFVLLFLLLSGPARGACAAQGEAPHSAVQTEGNP